MSKKTFEQALEDLGNIVASMESGDLTLDELLKNYETGIKLSSFCKKTLDQAEKKVEVLVKKADGSVDTEDFDEVYPSEDKKDKEIGQVESKKETENKLEKEIKTENKDFVEPQSTSVEEISGEAVVEQAVVAEEQSVDTDRGSVTEADNSDRIFDEKEEYTGSFEEDLLF